MRWNRVRVAIAVAVVITVFSLLVSISEWLPRLGIAAILALLGYELVIGSTYHIPETTQDKPEGEAG